MCMCIFIYPYTYTQIPYILLFLIFGAKQFSWKALEAGMFGPDRAKVSGLGAMSWVEEKVQEDLVA